MAGANKKKGSLAELMVRRYLDSCGVPNEAIPAGSTLDRGDIWIPADHGWPTIDVKHVSTLRLFDWVPRAAEQADNAGRDFGVVWHKKPRSTDPADWYVTTSGRMFVAHMLGGAR